MRARGFVRGLVLALCAAPALAQPAPNAAYCSRISMELAALDRSARQPAAGVGAQRLRRDYATASAQYHAMNCGGGGGGLFQIARPSPQCQALRARIGGLQAQIAQIDGPANAGNEARRRQLHAVWSAQCVARPQPVAVPQPPRPSGLFGALFGAPRAEPAPPEAPMLRRFPPMIQIEPEPDPDMPIDADDATRFRRFSGGKAVCVRSCDGFFFPLPSHPAGRATADDMCQALCPATATRVYYIPGGTDIEQARRPDGEAYADLPNALKFRKTVDASCGCRKPGQSWREVLAEAEQMLTTSRTDVVVTEEKSREMAKPVLRSGVEEPAPPAPQTPRPKTRRAVQAPIEPAEPPEGFPLAEPLDDAPRLPPRRRPGAMVPF